MAFFDKVSNLANTSNNQRHMAQKDGLVFI